jgi:hypothetical protein
VCAAALVLAGARLAAQYRPNLTGTWTLMPGYSGAGALNASWGWGFEFRAVHEPGALTVTYVGPGGSLKSVYILDGTLGKWEGSRLVVRERTAFSSDAKITLSLDYSGNLIVLQTSSMGEPVTKKYRRRL